MHSEPSPLSVHFLPSLSHNIEPQLDTTIYLRKTDLPMQQPTHAHHNQGRSSADSPARWHRYGSSKSGQMTLLRHPLRGLMAPLSTTSSFLVSSVQRIDPDGAQGRKIPVLLYIYCCSLFFIIILRFSFGGAAGTVARGSVPRCLSLTPVAKTRPSILLRMFE